MTNQSAKKIFLNLVVFTLLFFPFFASARSETPRAELQTGSTAATAASVATEEVSRLPAIFSPSGVELAYRIARVLSVVFAVLFINMILSGSFNYMTTSNDDKVLKARKNIIVGSIGTLVFICLYFVSTAAIVRIEAGL